MNNNLASEFTYDLIGNNMDIVQNYWVAWGIGFYNFCKNVMGFEVVKGPGTSMGVGAQFNDYTYSGVIDDEHFPGIVATFGQDNNWNRASGLEEENQTFIGQGGFNKTVNVEESNYDIIWNRRDRSPVTGKEWLEETEWLEWYNNDFNSGIDLTNERFDYIVFTGKNEDNSKIGFRIKFPIVTLVSENWREGLGNNCQVNISYGPIIMPWIQSDNINMNDYLLHEFIGANNYAIEKMNNLLANNFYYDMEDTRHLSYSVWYGNYSRWLLVGLTPMAFHLNDESYSSYIYKNSIWKIK
jgi:hypothetical protein